MCKHHHEKELENFIMQCVTTNVVLYSNSVLFHQYHLLLYIGHERENIHCGRKNRLTYERIDNGITSLCTGTRGREK